MMDSENHNCEKFYGKILHVMVDSNNKWFCCGCQRQLPFNHLHEKMRKIAEHNVQS
jgi:hypothetical protein